MINPRKTRATPETIRAIEFARLEAELACAAPAAAKSVTHCAGTTAGHYAGPKAAPLRPGADDHPRLPSLFMGQRRVRGMA